MYVKQTAGLWAASVFLTHLNVQLLGPFCSASNRYRAARVTMPSSESPVHHPLPVSGIVLFFPQLPSACLAALMCGGLLP